MKVLSRWTLAINTITLSSTVQLWPAPPGFADDLYSCIAVLNDLDSGGALRSRALIDALTKAFSLAVLWSDWGIDGQVKVWTRYMDVIETHCSIIIAIYR